MTDEIPTTQQTSIPRRIPTTPVTTTAPMPRGRYTDPSKTANVTLIAAAGITLISIFGAVGNLALFGAGGDDGGTWVLLGIVSMIAFAVWLATLVSAHIGVARKTVFVGADRTKMIWALVLAYVPVAISIVLFVIYLIGALLLFGFLALLFGGVSG